MKLKRLSNIFLFALFSLLVCPNTFADDICSNTNIPKDIRAASGCDIGTVSELPTVIINIINAIIGASGLVAVIFVIIGGIQYMTSAGDAGKAQKAKNTILYSIIGLIICVLTFAIVNWAVAIINNA